MSETNTGPSRGHSSSCTLQLHWTLFGSEATAWVPGCRAAGLVDPTASSTSGTQISLWKSDLFMDDLPIKNECGGFL